MRVSRAALAIACAIALGATSARAQQPATAAPKLEVGQWTGQVTSPNGQITDVTYDVTMKNDTLAITINAGQFGVFPAETIKLEADKLSFGFTPGPRVACVLTKNAEGAYAGTCTDDGGGVAQMTMVPPKKPGS